MKGIKKAIQCLKDNKSFVITSHTNLEGDALGSELAFWKLLKAMGKHAVIINEDTPPCNYTFLPHILRIKKFKKNMSNTRCDCFVLLDCSNLERCGKVASISRNAKSILNIDHHISNEMFGDVNWVDSSASCCAEMIYNLYKRLRLPLNRDIATFLYTGLLTDTGSFRYTNTTSLTHKIASELLKYDLRVAWIYKQVYENISFEDMRLLIKALSFIRRDDSGRIAWVKIRRGLLKNIDIRLDLAEEVLSFARAIKGTEVSILFKESLKNKDEVRVNLRSSGRVDVNKVASFFGGGGHKTASGATVKGDIETVSRQVLSKIRETLQ